MQRLNQQPQLNPMAGSAQKSNNSNLSKDLTQTLMDKNLSLMKSSQSMSTMQPNYNLGMMNTSPSLGAGFSANASTGWGGFAQAPSAGTAPGMNPGITLGSMPQSKPDLSAFDSLLSMPSSSQNRTPMGGMRPTGPTTMPNVPTMSNVSGMPTMGAMGSGANAMQVMRPGGNMMGMGMAGNMSSNSGTKQLSSNDINDLLS